MYAVVETGGKQVRCEVGKEIYVEKLDVEAGQEYTFDKVLMVAADEVKLGNPYVDGAKVVCDVVKQGLFKQFFFLR